MTPVQWVAALKQVAAMARSQLGPVGSTVGRVIDDAVPHFDRLRAIDSATIARRMRLALSAVGETAKDGSGDETATSVTTGEPIGIGENPE